MTNEWNQPTTDHIERRASESPSARALAQAATTRLARLQSITAALGNTITEDAVADSVLREAIVALECDAGAGVITTEAEGLTLLRECGSLGALMSSFEARRASACG